MLLRPDAPEVYMCRGYADLERVPSKLNLLDDLHLDLATKVDAITLSDPPPERSPSPCCPSSPLSKRCSTLYPGTKFTGYQTSGDKRYSVEVRIKEVDLAKSYLCGDLVIYGLTPQYPELATYFDAEIVGDRYDFKTGKWNSSYDVDLEHWRRFEPFKEIEKKRVEGGGGSAPGDSNIIFMRWKERFIVPVQKNDKLKGASFAGFYYICFNRSSGRIDGLYYHAKSEMYQRLYLTIEEDRKFGSCDFR
eukprot:m.181985 g.181985  ORF g.181985 m.181985 type:complete len:248 (-) comp24615_c1_seq1:113-856(-)